MSWDSYLALGDDAPGEYYDGHYMTAPSPDQQHQLACIDLVALLRAAVPAGYTVNAGRQWSPAPGQNAIPDVRRICRHQRNHQAHRHAAAGLAHYWVLDRIARQLRVSASPATDDSPGGVYEQPQVVGEEPADIGIATVTLDLPTLLGPVGRPRRSGHRQRWTANRCGSSYVFEYDECRDDERGPSVPTPDRCAVRRR